VSHNARADLGTERLRGQQSSLPDAQDCYQCANRCLDMWNDSADHAARALLLRMADAWLQLASESASGSERRRRIQTHVVGVFSRGRCHRLRPAVTVLVEPDRINALISRCSGPPRASGARP
jgi:hypothetical protein